MTEQTIPQILRAAAQAVRDLGFAKQTRHVENPNELTSKVGGVGYYNRGPEARIGSVCALGAIEIAVNRKWSLESVPQALRAVEAVAEHLPSGVLHPTSRLVNWNNTPERTGIELITLFEAAAACEEQKERKQG